MYDLDKLEGSSLTVREDVSESLTALDGKSYAAEKGDLVICDSVKPCCLAGVMGLKAVAVDEKTTRVGIEAASFYYAKIRRTSARLGLSSDSSSLFAKGVNGYLCEAALGCTLQLLKEFFPEAKLVGLDKYDESPPLRASYPFSLTRLNSRLGSSYSDDDILGVLKRLGLKYQEGQILTDPHRLDLVEQCDIDEEVFRLLDQSKISMS